LTKLAKKKTLNLGKIAQNFENYLKIADFRTTVDKAFASDALSTYSPGTASFSALCYTYDTAPTLALDKCAYEMVEKAYANSTYETSLKEEIKKAVSESVDKKEFPRFNKLLAEVSERCAFVIRKSDVKPVIDGEITAAEWGKPTFSGHFFQAYRITEKSPYKTTIWARINGKTLYLAFDCESDKKNMGSDLKSIKDDTKGVNTKMVKDDAISICVKRKGCRYIAIMLNSKGVLRASNVKVESKVKITKKGWQAELAVDSSSVGIRGIVKEGLTPTRMPIARYYRTVQEIGLGIKKKSKKVTLCSTLIPTSRKLGGTIGNGDFENLMTFVSGPIPVIEKSKPEPPVKTKK
jgi:hypothetical protein